MLDGEEDNAHDKEAIWTELTKETKHHIYEQYSYGQNGLVDSLRAIFSNTNLAPRARVCVCVCKIGPISARTLSFRHQTSRKCFHIATFPSPTFGPLFAFHCPLFFTKNNNLECRDVLKMVTVTTQDRPLNCKQQQWFSGTVLDSDLSDLSSNLIQVLQIFLAHYCLRLTTFTFNKWREYN